MDPTPFVTLPRDRALNRPDLPAELRAFYERNEGVGLESSPDRTVRICRADEVKLFGWQDVHIFGGDDWPGWETFSALLIGAGPFFDEIFYVLRAPSCPPGSILVFGTSIAGPGGTGPHAAEPSLVLAANFWDWLRRLERFGWMEFGIVPGELTNLPAAEQQEVRTCFASLNPGISWGTGPA